MAFELKTDFENRKEIARPTYKEILFGWLCKFKKYKEFVKRYKHGLKKVNQDLDITHILKKHRVNQVQLFSL